MLENVNNIAIEFLMKSELGAAIKKSLDTFEKVQEVLAALANSKDKNIALNLKIGTVLTFAAINKIIQGKAPAEFTKNDWQAILNHVIDEAVLADEQTYTENVFLLYAKYINASASIIETFTSQEKADSIHCLADEIRVKTDSLQSGEITEVEYIESCLWISLEAMIKLLSATAGSSKNAETANLIDGISTYAFEYGRFVLYRREQAIINEYIEKQYVLDSELQTKYDEFLNEVKVQSERFTQLVDHAFAPDFRDSLKGSIELAKAVGVKDDDILDSIERIDDFFLN